MKRILLLVALLVMAGISPIAAQQATPTATINPALTAQMDQLEAQTRAIRGLDGSSVVREFPTRAETIHYLTDSLAVQLPADEAARYLHFYTAFDLLPADTDLQAVYLRLLGAQVAGYYDSDTKIMHVIPVSKPITNALGLLEQFIYVHEYTHALQDQNFGLDALTHDPAITDNPDRSLATVSVIEGDATNVMSIWLQQLIQKNPLAALQMLTQSFQTGGLSMPEGTPPILVDELVFPYEQGLTFVMRLQRQGDMDSVDHAFTDPPTSTAQILHPQKYLDGWQPVSVALTDSAATLGAGWEQAWDSTLGEWYLAQYLKTQVAGSEATKAADGWKGDRFHIYADATGAQAWVLRLAWDSAAQEQEFAGTYLDFGTRRFNAAPQAGCWTNATETLCFREANGDFLIAQAPQQTQVKALLDAQAT